MSYSTILTNSAATAGLGLGISIANSIAEIILISLRFFNSGMVNYKIKIFFSIVSLFRQVAICKHARILVHKILVVAQRGCVFLLNLYNWASPSGPLK